MKTLEMSKITWFSYLSFCKSYKKGCMITGAGEQS